MCISCTSFNKNVASDPALATMWLCPWVAVSSVCLVCHLPRRHFLSSALREVRRTCSCGRDGLATTTVQRKGSQGALIKLHLWCRSTSIPTDERCNPTENPWQTPWLKESLFNMCIFSPPPSVVWPPAAYCCSGGSLPLPCGRPRPLGEGLSCTAEPERWWAAAKAASPAETSVSVASRRRSQPLKQRRRRVAWPDRGRSTNRDIWQGQTPPPPFLRRVIVAFNGPCYCAADCGCVRAATAHCFVAPAGCFLLRRLHFASLLSRRLQVLLLPGVNIVGFFCCCCCPFSTKIKTKKQEQQSGSYTRECFSGPSIGKFMCRAWRKDLYLGEQHRTAVQKICNKQVKISQCRSQKYFLYSLKGLCTAFFTAT